MQPKRILQLGLLFLSAASVIFFLPSLEVLPEQFPAVEIAVLLGLVAIFLLSIGARKFREASSDLAAGDNESVSTQIALDMADGKLDGQFGSHKDPGT